MKNRILKRAAMPLTTIYFALHYLQYSGEGPSLIRFYGKDLLLVPLLACATAAAAELSGRPQAIGIKEIVLTFIAVAVFFEGLLPVLSETVVGDPCDIAAYAAGAVLTGYAIHRDRILRHSV